MKDSAPIGFNDPFRFNFSNMIQDTKMEVEQSQQEGTDGERASNGQSGGSGFNFNGSTTSNDQLVFTFQPSSSSTSASTSTNSTRRRMIPPTSIPNFPSNNEPRDHMAVSPSPSKSPSSTFPFKSPVATPPHPPSLGTLPPAAFGGGAGGMQSPWLALAASSGAPTPSLDGPGRNSPQLGSPFEKLNIGGSWSGANLYDPAGRRASLEPPTPFTLSTSPGKSSLGTSSGFSFGDAMDHEQKSKSMDNAKKDRNQDMAVDAPETSRQKPPLPATLAARRASLPRNHVNVHGSVNSKAMSPLSTTSITNPNSSPSQKALPLAASSLGPMLANPSVLVLDLRPPSSFQAAHLPQAHSLPIPSTLLRRPAFTIEKMIGMLHGDSMQAVAEWRNKSDIILVDQDSMFVPSGHILDGLAGKFAREGYTGNIWFVKGGHGAVRSSGQGLIQSGEEEPSTPQVPGRTGLGGAGLMAGGMGRTAFQNSSTGGGGMLSPTNTRSGGSRTPGLQLRLDPFDQQGGSSGQSGSPTSSKKSSSYRGHSAMGDESTASTLQPANPFFDNIRQNMELSHGGITDRIPLGLPEEIATRASELPSFLAPLALMSDKDASDVLAKQFYQVELGEQKRLQAVMNWHTQDSGAMTNEKQAYQDRGQRSADREEVQRLASWGAAQISGTESSEADGGSEYFPFSITAGVERGTKNRYKNIWPYDFSRVRLGSPEDDSDYINASYIQPRGTSRRYIATQGPMDATYRDFWTLVWEQNVQVIAMITKQFEGGSVKCGNYWEDKKYGPLRVHQVSQTGGDDKTQTANTGFDFGMAAATPKTKDATQAHIKRVFEVSNVDHPEATPRKIVQIQCVSWPDFDVPESADVLLDLIRDVDTAFVDIYGSGKDRQEEPPVLVHCSAGVGRTGSFIVVDAILDALRREKISPKQDGEGETEAETAAPRPIIPLNSSAESPNQASTLDRSVEVPPPIPEEIDVEPQPPKIMSLSHANMVDHQRQSFMQHRGDNIGSVSARSTHSHAASNNSYNSSERRSMARSLEAFGVGKELRATTASKERANAATPLEDMENPVLEVLEGIRVQRMSLVQSLRQFVFVHRAIMTGYIQTIDGKRPPLSHTGSSGPTVLSIPNTASTSTDDDTHSKRRASPTELPHDDPMSAFREGSSGSDEPGVASLVKRPSFKKMRPSTVESISAASSGGTSRQSSPKKGV